MERYHLPSESEVLESGEEQCIIWPGARFGDSLSPTPSVSIAHPWNYYHAGAPRACGCVQPSTLTQCGAGAFDDSPALSPKARPAAARFPSSYVMDWHVNHTMHWAGVLGPVRTDCSCVCSKATASTQQESAGVAESTTHSWAATRTLILIPCSKGGEVVTAPVCGQGTCCSRLHGERS